MMSGPPVAIVTGAASGIGRLVASQLSGRAGFSVALVDIDSARLDEAVAEISTVGGTAIAVIADLRDVDAIPAWIGRIEHELGGIDLLVNNAAILGGEPVFPNSTLSSSANVVLVNLLAVVATTQIALQRMSVGGTILNIVSGSAFRHYASEAVYASTKAGVVHFTRCCATLHQSTGIRVNGFAPPLTDTTMFRNADGALPEWLGARIKDGASMHQPEQVATQLVDFILDEGANGEIRWFVPPKEDSE